MEDPNSRPPAAQLIADVIGDHFAQTRADLVAGQFRAGLSVAMQIYNVLKHAGYLSQCSYCGCLDCTKNNCLCGCLESGLTPDDLRPMTPDEITWVREQRK